MSNWITVFGFEVRQQIRRKSYLFVTFGVPLLALLAFFGYRLYDNLNKAESDEIKDPVTSVVEQEDSDKVLLGVLDLTPEGLFPAPETYPAVECQVSAEESQALMSSGASDDMRASLIKRISSPACLRDTIRPVTDLDEGKALLEDGTIDALYVIEPDFTKTGDISAYVKGFDPNALDSQSLMVDYVLRSALYSVAAEDYESLYLRLRDPAFVGVHQITADGTTQADSSDKNFALIYAFGLTIIMSIFWGGGYLMQSVVQEKESRIVEIVLSSARPTALLLGKTLAMAVVALIQVVVWVTVLIFLMTQAGDVVSALEGIEVPAGTVAVMAIYFALGYLLFGSMMAAIGAFSTSMREAQNFVVFVTLPAMIPFFFLTIFADEPNGTFATVLSLIPLTAPLAMVMRVVVTDVPLGQLALSAALLVASVAGAIWFAGRLFRVHTLLSGTMPKWRDIPKLIRG